MKSYVLFFALPCCALAANGTSAQSADAPAESNRPTPAILWKFTRGQSLRYQGHQDLDVRRVEGELTYPISESQRTVDIRWYVEDVDRDGTATITQTIERVQDSADEQKAKQEPGSEKSRPRKPSLAGTKFTFRLSRHGRTSDIALPSRVEKALEAKAPGDWASMLTQFLAQSMPGFPLPSDDSCRTQPWSHQVELSLPTLGLVKVTRQFDYAGQKQQPEGPAFDEFRLSSTAEIIDDPRVPFRYELNEFSAKGTLDFDTTAGRILASAERLRFEATMTLGIRSMQLRARGKTTWRLQNESAQPDSASAQGPDNASAQDKD